MSMLSKGSLETIQNIDFTSGKVPHQEFEQVAFKSCVFSDVAGISFTDCVFSDCNLSNVAFSDCRLNDVEFHNCKLVGANLSESRDFGFLVKFENCILDYVILSNKKLNKSSFTRCKIHSADFTDADLSKCRFHDCDFWDAVFANTNAGGVDFTTCKNFIIDPTINNIRKAKFLNSDLAGLLMKFDIIVK